jgi:steroid 5-alpha reductase family enzyme
MTLPLILFISLAVAAAVMTVAWAVHLYLGKASVADSFWGPGFAVIAWTTWILAPDPTLRSVLLLTLVTIWALRLAWHITRRSRNKPEDPRYREMRSKHPQTFWIRSLGTVFLLQAGLMWIVSLPVQLGIHSPVPHGLSWVDMLGLLLWLAGFFFEAVGDAQLARFKAEPANKGRILDTGLWAYTRHPNYFGETLMWWALFLIAVQVPGGLWSALGPLVLTFLLLRISGVRLTEATMDKSYSDLDRYKQQVSPFFPWPPHKTPKQHPR